MNARILTLLCGLLVSSTTFADISYDFVEVGFGIVAVDVPAPLDGDGAGPQLQASYGIYGPFTANLEVRYTDFSKDNIELTDINPGLGWHYPLGKNASTFVTVSYLYTDISAPGLSGVSQDGFGVTLGYRAENHSPWEFIGTIDYVNVESGVELGGGVTLMYDVSRNFSVSGGASYFDQSVMAHLGARYSVNTGKRR